MRLGNGTVRASQLFVIKLTERARLQIVVAYIFSSLSSIVKACVQRQPKFPECRHVIHFGMLHAQKHLINQSVGGKRSVGGNATYDVAPQRSFQGTNGGLPSEFVKTCIASCAI